MARVKRLKLKGIKKTQKSKEDDGPDEAGTSYIDIGVAVNGPEVWVAIEAMKNGTLVHIFLEVLEE